MKQCPQCKLELEEGVTLCPGCHTALDENAAAEPEHKPETQAAEQQMEESAQEVVTPEETPCEEGLEAEAELQPKTPFPQEEIGQSQLPNQTQKKKKLKKRIVIISLSVFLVLVAALVGGIYWAIHYFDPANPGAQLELPAILQSDLRELLEKKEAQVYGFYDQSDKELGINAYRLLMPDGWRIQGSTSYNAPGTAYPMQYSAWLTAQDGLGKMFVTSDLMFVDGGGKETSIPLQKQAMDLDLSDMKQFISEFLSSAGNISLLMFSKETKLLKDNKLLEQYKAYLAPTIAGYKEQGITLKDIQLYYNELEGNCIYQSVPDTQTIVRLAVCSYTLEKKDADKTESLRVYTIPQLVVFAAPNGTLQNYLPDMRFMAANFRLNQNWLAARARAAAEALHMVEGGEVADWSGLLENIAKLKTAAKKDLNTQDNFALPAAEQFAIHNFTMAINSYPRYELPVQGGNMPIYVEKAFTKVWYSKIDEEDTIVMGVKPEDYKPGSGFSWEQLTAAE